MIRHVALEAADDFVGLNGVVFARQNVFGGSDEAVHIAGTVVRVRQQGEDFGDFVVDLAVLKSVFAMPYSRTVCW